MHHRSLRIGSGILAAGLLAAPTALAGPRVHVRVEGAKRTRVPDVRVAATGRRVTKAGGSCSGSSAAGALDRAAHGRWTATFYESFGDYLIEAIRGEAHAGGPTYWAFWVDGHYAQQGICQTPLRPGDHVLFLVDSTRRHVRPLGLRAPGRVRAGRRFAVHAIKYADDGTRTPIRGALVSGDGRHARTDRHGVARFRIRRPGRLHLRASRGGFARSETHTLRVVR